MEIKSNTRPVPNDKILLENLKNTIMEFYYQENKTEPEKMSIGYMLFSLNSVHTNMINTGWALGSKESVEQFLERVE